MRKILYLFKDIPVFKWLAPSQFVHQAFADELSYIIFMPTKWKLCYCAYVLSLGIRVNINSEYINWS